MDTFRWALMLTLKKTEMLSNLDIDFGAQFRNEGI
jgi:hypothetical protein